jgi:hypothetical protein
MNPAPFVELQDPVLDFLARLSGTYQGSNSSIRMDLRIDLHGKSSTRRISGDYIEVSGSTEHYKGSFVVDQPEIQAPGADSILITGTGRFTFPASTPQVRLTIPRVAPQEPLPPVLLDIASLDGTSRASYECSFESPFFRIVKIKQSVEDGVTPFDFFEVPIEGTTTSVSLHDAYAAAGIKLEPTGVIQPIQPGFQGFDGLWNDAELHEAMEQSFKSLKKAPAWKVWLFHASSYIDSGARGMMFDKKDPQRQGCAVFYELLKGNPRDQLFTCVHEIGHCFNMVHSSRKHTLVPPLPDRPDALSWMNKPSSFQGGEEAFWSQFRSRLSFDGDELIHLRHAFLNNIIMGGAAFKDNGALNILERFREPIKDESGLQLVLDAPKSLDFGEPVWAEIKLYWKEEKRERVHTHLHPREGYVDICIQRPDGKQVLFEPLFERCMSLSISELCKERPSIYSNAYLGFGKGGFYFDQPGFYRIRASYLALDGSRVVSNTLKLRVCAPLNRKENHLADLYFGDDQGMLICFRGSDSELLRSGNDALDEVIEKYGDQPMADYARLVKGYNLSREFKTVKPDGKVLRRAARPEEALRVLKPMIDEFKAGKTRIGNITFSRTMLRLAQSQAEEGNEKGAGATLDQMYEPLKRKMLKPHVLKLLREQARGVLPEWQRK